MPYKDPRRKQDWERQHRSQRLARRRELRRIAAAQVSAESAQDGKPAGLLLLPFLMGGSLAVYSPKLAIGAGSLTLLVAAAYKKAWIWWVLGAFTLVLAIFFQWNSQSESSESSEVVL